MEPLLPPVHPPPLPRFIQIRLFLLAADETLALPFRDGGGGLELDGEPGARADGEVATDGHAFLAVPETDEGAGAVAVIADGMGVDRAVDPLAAHPGARRLQGLVAGA